MSLVEYRRKRDFKKTAEPRGGKAARDDVLTFVVHKHAATRLHYDLRLELDGVLKSWAVPKGPSLDPKERRLAVHVEDHPLEYGSFEGTIPEGEYGGGAVVLWDRGEWQPLGDARKDYKDGKLKFVLKGEKLRGGWTLVRIRGDEKNWLLIKETKDPEARPGDGDGILEREPASVLSGKTIEQVAEEGGISPKKSRKASRTSAKLIAPAKRGVSQPSISEPQQDRDAVLLTDLEQVRGARKAPMPTDLKPQLATLAKGAPAGEQWLHEIKFDGYRILAFLEDRRPRLMTRNGNDWSHRFASIAAAVKTLPVRNCIIDGEVVVLRKDGTHDFQALQNALRQPGPSPLTYCIFDLPYLDGYDLRRCALTDRKRVLQALLDSRGVDKQRLLFSAHLEGHGPELFKQVCGMRLEGLISKRSDSTYESTRTQTWLKVKCVREQEFVIGGYTDPAGTREAFGALLVGYYEDGKLRYSGKVGTGFDDAELVRLHKRMRGLAIDSSPFSDAVPRADARHAHWIRPELVAQVTFTEWTSDGRLRHPSYVGLREDKDPATVGREMAQSLSQVASRSKSAASKRNGRAASSASAAPAQAGEKAKPRAATPAAQPKAASKGGAGAKETSFHGVRLTSPGKVLYPEQGLTKQDLAEYYLKVAKLMLPHIVDRPLSLVRCPEGHLKGCFFQKHVPDQRTQWMHEVTVQEKSGPAIYVYIKDEKGLLSLVQMGVLEMHIWGSRVDRYDRPDRMVFDLDPDPTVGFDEVKDAARLLRARLKAINLDSFLKTTGGKGLHVVAPLERRGDWDQVKAFSEAVSRSIVAEFPNKFVATMSKAKRVGKIFIDYLRNGQGATWIAPYSTRARPHAPVSMPLAWEELDDLQSANQFTVTTIEQRLKEKKRDPWKGIATRKQGISARLLKAIGSA